MQFYHNFTEIGIRFHQLMRVNEGINIAPVAVVGFKDNWFQGTVIETFKSSFSEVLDEIWFVLVASGF